MVFSFLTPDNLNTRFKDSEKAMNPLFLPLKEYERLGRNEPHPGIDPAYPKTTDGTLASIAQETPKRYIQQLPTGTVETSMGTWMDIFAQWKLLEDIIPHANCQADVLQKSWQAGTKSMWYGSQPAYVFIENEADYMGANFKLPYITHVYYERGKISARESNFIFMEAWYQESDIDYIIYREKKLKKEDPEYKGKWDIKELEDVKKKKQAKQEDQKNPQERKSGGSADSDTEGIRIIHAFQKGVGAKFYSFAPDYSESASVKIVRTKVNPDPRGVIPIHTLYYNVDFSNPLGRGAIAMTGGMQNLIDSHVQAFQYMQALNMNPPIKKKGNVPKGAIKFIPNAIIDLGNDPNADIEPLTINSQAITNFPTTYGLMKSQILALNASNDTTVSAKSGDPASSKTPAGVEATMQRMGVSDNYARKQFETWIADIYETSLNLTFAETTGVREETLDEKTADKLRIELEKDPEGIGNQVIIFDAMNSNKVYVDYDMLGEEPVYFKVDASTSQVKDDQNQVESLATTKELVIDLLPESKRMLFANKFIQKIGVEDPEDITFSKEEIQETVDAEQLAKEQAMMGGQDIGMGGDMAMTPEEELVALLDEAGVPEQYFQSAYALLQEGLAPQQVVQLIVQKLQGVA